MCRKRLRKTMENVSDWSVMFQIRRNFNSLTVWLQHVICLWLLNWDMWCLEMWSRMVRWRAWWFWWWVVGRGGGGGDGHSPGGWADGGGSRSRQKRSRKGRYSGKRHQEWVQLQCECEAEQLFVFFVKLNSCFVFFVKLNSCFVFFVKLNSCFVFFAQTA